jgi:hypothetical protein
MRRPSGWPCDSHSRRAFSTASADRTATPANNRQALRSLVKPFLLRCHPDVQSVPAAREINLVAIQNLNSFLDRMESLSAATAPRSNAHDEAPVEIDFCLPLPPSEQDVLTKKSSKHRTASTTSRRKVQLRWPAALASPTAVRHHAVGELARLLQVAGLEVPASMWVGPEEDGDPEDPFATAADDDDTLHGWDRTWADTLNLDREDDRLRQQQERSQQQGARLRHHHAQYARLRASRDHLTRSINWSKVNELYAQAWQEAQAEVATRGFLRNNRERRQGLIAKILARVQPDDDVSLLERWASMRRLALLLDHSFDKLQLEECAAFWERVNIRLTAARSYNTSASALYKRQQLQVDNGFAFGLEANGQVSLQIPLDFRDDELLQEWDSNIWDFYELAGDDMEDILFQQG